MAERPPSGRSISASWRQDWRLRAGVGGVLAVLGIWFVVENSETTRVQLFFWTVSVPLIWVLLAMVLLGVLIDRLVIWRRGRGRARP
ncbi:MAG TPA: LapA family protein [Actinomycetes bacterium]